MIHYCSLRLEIEGIFLKNKNKDKENKKGEALSLLFV